MSAKQRLETSVLSVGSVLTFLFQKAEKNEKLEIAKTKKAIAKGNPEVARVHAENAIRQKNQSLNYLKMSARVDAVSR